ncbi:carbohydrate ABC transporter permease [Jiangella aurantiaca]|uniref:Carbohydrate ABC transporter permease n=1 Tax=Jiangella aurantiaca TaxID=2530373 RepID=A0A4V2YRS7_9ACTN|nr:carbohydrate ABC transporter permease [Jiangella aurantiaca]TDD67487.1 carbohydrate ABC transporter permease [Jiangella aurantiaca]
MTTDTARAGDVRTTSGPPPGERRRPADRGRRRKSLVKHLVLTAACLLMIYPLAWMVVSSLRPEGEVFRQTGLLLTDPRPENYERGWNALRYPFGHYLLNSLAVVVFSIVGNLVSCSMAAYAFARQEFRGRKLLFAIMLVSIMLPLHVVIVPQYILFSELGWVNTLLPLVLPKFLATDAFFVFLMVQFIRGIPRELDEAARIDGAGHVAIFTRIILPLLVPALATTAIFTFIWTWNDFFTPLIYLTSPDAYTVPVALRSFVDSQGATSWGALFAMSVLSLLPVFIAFLIGQRLLVRGIATTGLK